jgi:ribosomal protein S18 acetylase RimI-like enzyme
MAEIIIRKYRDSDKAALKDTIKTENTDELTVAEYNGVAAGYLWLSIARGNCQAFIFVSPEYRRRKIGTALCSEAVRLCREAGENEMWCMGYEYETGKNFADSVGCYYITSSIRMKYTGGMLPERGIFENIRKCREEDYQVCTYLWDKGYYEMQLRIGNPGAKMREPDNDDKQNFAKDIDSSYVIEENGRIVAYGVISGDSIGALAVDTELSNKGYGSALAAFMTNEILRRGSSNNGNAYLWCETENANARRIYEKIGYKEAETCCTYFKKV